MQAKALGLPKQPYFNPKDGLLSRDVNEGLWRMIVSLTFLLLVWSGGEEEEEGRVS